MTEIEDLTNMNHRMFGLAIARYLREEYGFDLFNEVGIPCKEYSQTGLLEDTKRLTDRAISMARVRPLPRNYLDNAATRFQGQLDSEYFASAWEAGGQIGAPVRSEPAPAAPAAPARGDEEAERLERQRALIEALGQELARPAPSAVNPADVEKIVSPIIQAAIDQLSADTQLGLDQLGKVIAEIRDLAKSGPAVKQRVRRAINQATGAATSKMEELFAEYCEPGSSQYPVQITGGSGIGKTYQALQWAKNFDRCVMIGGSEALDFTGAIGWNVPGVGQNGQASLVYRDGDISSAFRCVRLDERGQPAPGTLSNCILIMDELNRMDLKIQGSLIPALGILRHPVTGEECYRLVTEKHSPEAPKSYNNGVTETEILWAPVARLAIIATSNEGADFQVQNVDEAGQARFVKHRVYYVRSEAEAIYRGELAAYGYSEADKRGKQLCDLAERVTTLKNVQGVFNATLSTRIFCREIKAANGWDDLCKKLHADVVNHCCKLDANDYIDSLSAKAADAAVKDCLGWAPQNPTGQCGVS